MRTTETANSGDPSHVWADVVSKAYDHVYLHRGGPDQAGFLRFVWDERPPALERRHRDQEAAQKAA